MEPLSSFLILVYQGDRNKILLFKLKALTSAMKQMEYLSCNDFKIRYAIGDGL